VLQPAKTRSSLVAETKSHLVNFSLLIVYDYFGYLDNVPGNEIADELAKQAVLNLYLGSLAILPKTQLCLGLRNIVISGSLQRAADKQKCSFKALTSDL